MEALPREIVLEIAEFLPANDIYRLRCSTKKLHEFDALELVWIRKADWWQISETPGLTEKFIAKYANYVIWSRISRFQVLSEKFMKKYVCRISWHWVASDQTHVSEEFLGKFADKLVWADIAVYRQLSAEFIRKYSDRLNWDFISLCQNLTEDLIIENISKISPEYLAKNKLIPKELREKYGKLPAT